MTKRQMENAAIKHCVFFFLFFFAFFAHHPLLCSNLQESSEIIGFLQIMLANTSDEIMKNAYMYFLKEYVSLYNVTRF